MKYYVNLVHRGISAGTHSLSGKSGVNYGTATASPEHGGVVFKMTMEEYLKNAHDIVGNTAPQQQWVPEFVPEPADTKAPMRCSIPAGCPKPATYLWDRHPFCEDHAPNNAISLIDGTPRSATAAPTPSVVQRTEERPAVTEPNEEPIVQFAPPPVASEDVAAATRSPEVQTPPAPAPEVHPTPATTPAVASETVQPGPRQVAESPKVVDVISAAVAQAVGNTLPGALADMETRIVEKLQMKPTASTKQKKRHGGPNLAPTAFQVVQQEAKNLGINTFQKGKAQLEKEIAEKKANP